MNGIRERKKAREERRKARRLTSFGLGREIRRGIQENLANAGLRGVKVGEPPKPLRGKPLRLRKREW